MLAPDTKRNDRPVSTTAFTRAASLRNESPLARNCSHDSGYRWCSQMTSSLDRSRWRRTRIHGVRRATWAMSTTRFFTFDIADMRGDRTRPENSATADREDLVVPVVLDAEPLDLGDHVGVELDGARLVTVGQIVPIGHLATRGTAPQVAELLAG